MTPPLLDVEADATGNASLMTSASSMESVFQKSPGLTERNYLGLSDCSSVDSSAVSGMSEVKRDNLNLKATELRLGLPGSQSPVRDSDDCLDEKPLFPLVPSKEGICLGSQKIVVSGNKRGFSDTIGEGNWMFGSSVIDSDGSKSLVQGKFTGNTSVSGKISSGTQAAMIKDAASKVSPQEQTHVPYGTSLNKASASNPPAAKAQVVGWPPVRSFRKNILATNSKNNDEVDGKPGPAALFVKVSMDGAPYLRKVDLRSYTTYQQLSSALEKMFSCFTIGQCGASGRESLSESKLRDLLHGSEYVLTYEDKDGDWMLVGDVPWDMFIGSCKRLKIMKGSDAIGLAPRAMEKSKNRN
ncbi:putative transcription factor interactor and regulator AUX-IAA family [Helianthus annuus]|uniref:Auxin-responsive protein n=1 Tax=Helianthus annuus TaxID=4232 RepID=A0A251T6V2_HELAN|nr:auxin-responsive protein IAA8 [Helianthus annuus]XP_021992537.1 auxin-responsive protein IAA8 [Helianthus annuus]KAF5780238.1 putative transcription factor interactor and regulator AUX-IAA family [Helianthus annuus]KAJ0507427.1 putative transcription factor interactor and regulator AUX-IAA family [Helianthus annuus]KAJ0515915.1 putative transcription factor interactor and regulator AUX-IAA family [Helianthus annuus]KAJ0868907.1 putative transcription factor interactor and regulator AUX-IAA 